MWRVQAVRVSSGCLAGNSAVCTMLCKEALGKITSNVFSSWWDYTNSRSDTCEAFRETFHVKCKEIEISPFVMLFQEAPKTKEEDYLANINHVCEWSCYTNMQMRPTALSAVRPTNQKSWLGILLNTGWWRRFSPLGDLYITRFPARQYLKIPAPIIRKPPTAGSGLGRPMKKSPDELSDLDQILYGLELKMDIVRYNDSLKCQEHRLNDPDHADEKST